MQVFQSLSNLLESLLGLIHLQTTFCEQVVDQGSFFCKLQDYDAIGFCFLFEALLAFNFVNGSFFIEFVQLDDILMFWNLL